LAKWGEPVVETLIEVLEEGDEWNRPAAAKALGKIGDERAVKPLVKLLEDDNEYIRESAAEALGKIGDIRSVEPLIGMLSKEKRGEWANYWTAGAQAAKEALEKLGHEVK
ncbi:MAG: HEAT repeat domain-containing protein, partial [Candidatus Thermoplasmatota archaeon]|nr:HEAT repeat domain-containing protein [Candidatus Thermoplasmatota archaeon]